MDMKRLIDYTGFDHINARNTVTGGTPRFGKSLYGEVLWKHCVANCSDEVTPISVYGHYEVEDKMIETDKEIFFMEKTGWALNHPKFKQYYVADTNGGIQRDTKFQRILEILDRETIVKDVLEQLDNHCRIMEYREYRFENSYRFDNWINIVLDSNIETIIDECTGDIRYTNKNETEVENMGLRIKKTDVLNVDEFRENTKAYDEVIVKLNKDKVEQYKLDYGIDLNVPFEKDGDDIVVKLTNQTIEFYPKAILLINGCHYSLHFEFIDEFVCVYYLTTE